MRHLRNMRLERYAIGDSIWDVWFERYEIGKICDWRDVQYDWKNDLREVWLDRRLVIWFDMFDLRDKRFEKCAMCWKKWFERSAIGEAIDDLIWDVRYAKYATGEVIGDLIWDVRLERYAIGKICNVIEKVIWEKYDWRGDWRLDLRCAILEMCDWM